MKEWYVDKCRYIFMMAQCQPLTTKQVAEKSGIAWQTAKDNLTSLHEKNYVNRNADQSMKEKTE